MRKKQGRPTRDTLGKVWLDWAGEYVDPADPRAQPPFVDPAAVREMEVRLEKEQQRVAKHQAPADVKLHQRGAEPCVSSGKLKAPSLICAEKWVIGRNEVYEQTRCFETPPSNALHRFQ